MSEFLANFPIGDVEAIGVVPTDTSDLVELPNKDSPDIMIINGGTVTAFVRVGSIGSVLPAAGLLDFTAGNAAIDDTVVIEGRTYTFVGKMSAGFASSELTLTANAGVGETVTVGGQLYTFVNTLDAPVHALGDLANLSPALAGNTVTIGTDVYTFVENLDADEPFDVLLTGNNTDDLANLRDAINNGPGEGTTYGDFTPKSTFVTAQLDGGDNMEVTAIVAGPDGNNINTSADLDGGTFASPFLGLGAFPSAYEVVIGADADASLQHLSLAVTRANSVGLNYMYGQGTEPNPDAVMTFDSGGIAIARARVAGVAGNSIVTLTDLTFGTWDGATMANGADAAAPDDVLEGNTVAESISNLVDAINAAAFQEGITFGIGTIINPDISAAINDAETGMIATSKLYGVLGNATTTTAVIASGSDWDAATLLGGLDDFGAVEADLLAMPVIGGEKGVYNIGKDLLNTNRPLALAFMTATGSTTLSIIQGHGA